MESFIRILPASWDAQFIANSSGSKHFMTIETYKDESNNDVTKHVFFFAIEGMEPGLDAIIADYNENYTTFAKPQNIKKIIDRMYFEFSKGFSVTSDISTALAGKFLQVRDVEDRTNWLTSQVSYAAAISAGLGETVGARFRTVSNETIEVSYSEGYNVLLKMADWGASIMHRCWILKDAINAATNPEELSAIMSTLEDGWPSSPTT